MNPFEALLADFSAKTGLNLAPDERQGCFLETDGILITVQHRQEADDIVISHRTFPLKPSIEALVAPWLQCPRMPLRCRSTMAPAVALDPEGREAAFSYVGAGDARPVFKLEVNRVGEINVDCELEMHPAALLVGGETHELAPGATVKGTFRCSIYPEERRRIAEVDLAHADTAAAEEFYNRNPPETNRLRGAYDLIPDPVRPNLAVGAAFDILNA